MSSAASTPEVLSADECKEFFELGTAAMLEYFTSVLAAKDAAELQPILHDFFKERLEELKFDKQTLKASLEDPEIPADEIARTKDDLESVRDQISYFQDELKDIDVMDPERFASYQESANNFINGRQKLLDNWESNYNSDPLQVIDTDGTSVAIAANDRSLTQWVDDMLSRTLG